MKKIDKILKTVFAIILATSTLTSCGTSAPNESYSSETTSSTFTSKLTLTSDVTTTSDTSTTSISTTTSETTTNTTTAKSTSKRSKTSKSTTTSKSTIISIDEGKDKDNANAGKSTFKDTTAMKIVKDMKIGWNLGNTLDSVHWETGNNLPTKPSAFETAWNNPVTTKKMIDTVKAGGFNTLRVPVTWFQHLGAAPDYKINKAWLDRVQEVVDYGIDNDMYVILNLHHENWHFPSKQNLPSAKAKLQKVWGQIAERFKNYDEHLIFEGMNEPRMNDTPEEWNGGNAEARDAINQLNAAFVNTIRKSKGNNPKRFLMIPTYAASPWENVTSSMKIPGNDGRIIVSVHSYEPYSFALDTGGVNKWSKSKKEDTQTIDYVMDSLHKTFVSKGIPVVMGEFGALNKNNLSDRVAWAEYYVRAAKKKDITCIWWDNGSFSGSGENFGILNRKQNKWQYPEIVKALMKGLK